MLLPALIMSKIVSRPEYLCGLHRHQARRVGSTRARGLDHTRLLAKPVDRGAQPVLKRGRGPEAELPDSPCRVQHAPGLSVGLGRIPVDLAGEAGDACDHLDQITNAYLLTDADING